MGEMRGEGGFLFSARLFSTFSFLKFLPDWRTLRSKLRSFTNGLRQIIAFWKANRICHNKVWTHFLIFE